MNFGVVLFFLAAFKSTFGAHHGVSGGGAGHSQTHGAGHVQMFGAHHGVSGGGIGHNQAHGVGHMQTFGAHNGVSGGGAGHSQTHGAFGHVIKPKLPNA